MIAPGNVIELRGIVKRFGAVTANQRVNLAVRAGEIHAIVGENGAGKSTLMNILYGLYHPDEGEIVLNGETIRRHAPQNSIRHGIGMVHQHFMLIPPLTVAENVVLGQEPARGLTLDLATAAAKIRELSDSFHLQLDPDRTVADLSVGENQRVEIIKVLYRGANILILDEPTAVLTPAEVTELFTVIRGLVAQGKTVIVITHKLDEVMALSDRVTVMRHGETVGTVATKETTPANLAKLMVGREVLLQVEKPPATTGEPVLAVADLSAARNRDVLALDRVSFTIRGGEILGLAGVEGNGQSELIDAIMGLNLHRLRGGSIRLFGRELGCCPTRDRLAAGMSHIPEDRHHRGLVLEYSVQDNLILGQQHEFTRTGFLQAAAIAAHSEQLIHKFDIRPADGEVAVGGLSGGNQQKVIIAREFHRDFSFLLAAQPTRGVDIGAIEFIHRQILAARAAGKAVLLISAELTELLSLSDRIAVLYKGRLVKTLDAGATNAAELGMLMTGASRG